VVQTAKTGGSNRPEKVEAGPFHTWTGCEYSYLAGVVRAGNDTRLSGIWIAEMGWGKCLPSEFNVSIVAVSHPASVADRTTQWNEVRDE
jgi:hypothetical protein